MVDAVFSVNVFVLAGQVHFGARRPIVVVSGKPVIFAQWVARVNAPARGRTGANDPGAKGMTPGRTIGSGSAAACF